MHLKSGLSAVVVVTVLGASSSALAQATNANENTAKPATAAPAGMSKTEEARQRYERGVKLYEDGAYDGARLEFERAYQLAPTFRLLYNIGVVYGQLADFVGAIKNLEAYLYEGGDQVPEERRAEVTKLLGELRGRVGKLSVKVNQPGADVAIDDIPIGTSPLPDALMVNPGRRKVSASKKGWLPTTKTIEVASAESAAIELDLQAPPTVVREAPPRRVPWVGWGATAALGIGAGVFGFLAITNSDKLEEAKVGPNPDPDDLDSRASTTRTFGYLADGLGVAAVVVGGISLYYTIKWGKTEQPTATTARISPRPGGAAVTFSF